MSITSERTAERFFQHRLINQGTTAADLTLGVKRKLK